jgi:hypothetical protein
MGALSVQVIDWAARAPGRQSKAEWHAWAGASAPTERAAELPLDMPPLDMPMMLRRRAGQMGQQALAAAYAVGAPARPGLRYIFSSRHGDFRRTAGLLRALAMQEPLSPAEFSVSVHNALAGLLSIATKATAGHTAIAAGPDSFACGMIEAAAALVEAPADPVLLIYVDEPLPAPYDELAVADGEAIAMALLMGATAAPPGARQHAIEMTATRHSGQANPASGVAFDFLRFLVTGAATTRSCGERIAMEWRRAG